MRGNLGSYGKNVLREARRRVCVRAWKPGNVCVRKDGEVLHRMERAVRMGVEVLHLYGTSCVLREAPVCVRKGIAKCVCVDALRRM